MESGIGIIIVNTGSPDDPSPEAVRRYLARFLSDERIVPMNRLAWSIVLRLFVLPRRSVRSAEKYASIWDGEFAFIRDHRLLAQKLERRCAERGVDAVVESAMSFGEPSLESVMGRLAARGCDELVVLPLYPQNAYSQAGIVADEVARVAEAGGWQGRYRVLGDYSENEAYLDAIAASIRASGFDSRHDRLLMSFHSIPLADVRAGDAYGQAVVGTCRALAKRLALGDDAWRMGFQSRFDKGRRWLGPFNGEILREWASEGFAGRLFVVCPNFAVDCLETYHDIMREMRTRWMQMRPASDEADADGSFVYVPCLGASDAHVDALIDVLGIGDCRS